MNSKGLPGLNQDADIQKIQEKNVQPFGYPSLISYVTITIAVILMIYGDDFLLIFGGVILLLWWCYLSLCYLWHIINGRKTQSAENQDLSCSTVDGTAREFLV